MAALGGALAQRAGATSAGGTGADVRGSQASTTPTPPNAMTAATPAAQCIAVTNESLAALIRRGPADPRCGATAYAEETDDDAASRSGGGSRFAVSAMSRRNTLATSDPITATPSAPPTWRTVFWIAEPTPAPSRGPDDMMDSVAGGITLAMPAPWMKKYTQTNQIGESTPRVARPTRPSVTRPSPTALTARGPNRFTIVELSGAKTSWATANGVISRPAC